MQAHLVGAIILVLVGYSLALPSAHLTYPRSAAYEQALDEITSEQVDRLAGTAGDSYWHSEQRQSAQQPQVDWYLRALNRLQSDQEEPVDEQASMDKYPLRAEKRQPGGGYAQDLDGLSGGSGGSPGSPGMRNYRALVNDYKHWAAMSNPSREGRAFKPKLMSTARGFGKRANDLAKSIGANLNSPASSSVGPFSRTNRGAISNNSKYEELFSQMLQTRWPKMDKYSSDKLVDYNGDGIISTDEKQQSL